MNKELNKLLIFLDNKINAYRLINQFKDKTLSLDDKRLLQLIEIQKEIQKLYNENRNNKGIIKKRE